jgi:TonB family protein
MGALNKPTSDAINCTLFLAMALPTLFILWARNRRKWKGLLLLTMALSALVNLPATVGIAQNLPPPSKDPFIGKQTMQPAVAEERAYQGPAPGNQEDKEGISEEYEQGFTKISFGDILGSKSYEYFLLSNPPRLVVDIPEPRRELSLRKRTLKGEAFHRVRVGQYSDKVRLVLDFRKGDCNEPSVTADGRDLIVFVMSNTSEPDSGLTPEVLFEETQGEQEEGSEGRSSTTIRKTVAQYLGGLQYLYNKELRKDPTLKGKVTVTFEIAPSGLVTETVLLSSSISSKSLVEAILNSIRNWKFPAVSEEYGNLRVTYPFSFAIRTL